VNTVGRAKELVTVGVHPHGIDQEDDRPPAPCPDHLADADREPKVRAAAFEEYHARVDAVYRAYRRVHPPHRHRRGVTVTVPRMIYPEAFEIALTAAPGRRRRV